MALRIAQVSPLYESVPPTLYGGTERVVSYLTEELVKQGHEVTLFASGDSRTSAELVRCAPRSLRLDVGCLDQFAHHVRMLGEVQRRASDFDLIHYHIDYLHFPMSRLLPTPNVTTLHGRLDIPDQETVYLEYPEMPLVSISDAQRLPLRWANWIGTVYHGLPEDLYTPQEAPGQYLAFLGRISPEKCPEAAIELAKRTGIPLKIAAKVDRVDRDYFEERVKPLLDHPLVEFIGEIGEKEKNEFLGHAYALVFLVDWPEPFGLAMIEAMACGTPVIARRRGSVPEVVDDGQTGYIVEDLDQAVQGVERVGKLDRRRVRQVFEQRFSAARMVRDYLGIYRRLAASGDKLESEGVAA